MRYSFSYSTDTFWRFNKVSTKEVWDNQKQNLINKFENIQLDAARIVTGKPD
jgi:hypothetical protein